MLFQAIDDKKNCVGIYTNGDLIFGKIPTGLTKTWKYADYLDGHDIEYAYIYCNGKKLHEVCPDDLKDDWKRITRTFEAYIKSFQIAKISLYDNCMYDLIPHGFLKEFFDIRNKITGHVFDVHDKPKNYDFLNKTYKTVYDIKHQELKIDFSELNKNTTAYRTREYAANLKKYDNRCDFNIFGTVTGRFTNVANSFPILTMPKQVRCIIKPKNDWFVTLDYNGAELRTLISLLGNEQPDYDIHDWNVKNIFKNKLTRDEAKLKFFAWLYNPKSNEIKTDVYDRNQILDNYWHKGVLMTEYDREITVDRSKALNYCLQSTCADTISDRMNELHKFLKDKKSNIAFSIHDEIVIDMADEERHCIPEIVEIFSNNKLGNFLTTVKAGKSFGDLKELKYD